MVRHNLLGKRGRKKAEKERKKERKKESIEVETEPLCDTCQCYAHGQ
jgi:hypothetical protein